ncbi:ABC transporter ATP-binding protein [Aquamicrobium sp. LC103]|uniref:ABC transporter ATP-binding protein n=1 Tax=Aquamicrobium sp. LC103 TaxID=1120658 RepID=UPI00063E784E|nr:ABC transporter ATP-binding protein [Aquamicrobium sp. LC103]TKT78290.1 ABC transporter ATP-binding protein [Aquamicrobium sp. LC103]
MSALLSVRDLSIAFGSHRAVEGLSFDVAPGETVAIVGESGSGKSATSLAIMRLIEREGGSIVNGSMQFGEAERIDLATADEATMRRVRGNRIAMVFQEPITSLNPVMRVGDQVAEVLIRHRGLSRKDALAEAERAFEHVHIPDPKKRLHQFPHELSGGLRQRVMIAMALACRPRLLIADEPTTALDVTTQSEILTLIRSLQKEIGMAVLFITHDMGVVAEIAERVVVMRKGAHIEAADVATFFSNPRTSYSRQLLAATPKLGSGAPEAPALSAPVLEVKSLSTSFAASALRGSSRTMAVNNVSITLGKGETLGLVGESGCGKSSLARSILRLVEPETGEIHLAGRDWLRLSSDELRAARRDAQMVFQDPYASLNPRMAIRDAITEPAQIHKLVSARDARDLAVRLVERVGLDADSVDRFPHQFSGGQRQRLAIARALSVQPKLIIADEAVSALDVSIARQVTDLMLELQRSEGVSLLFISHDIAVVERVSHRVAVMYRGEIVETGRTDDVLGAPRHEYTRRLLSAVPRPPLPAPAFQSRRRNDMNARSVLPGDRIHALETLNG